MTKDGMLVGGFAATDLELDAIRVLHDFTFFRGGLTPVDLRGEDTVFYVLCAACGETIPETEAEPTKAGLMHLSCAERRYQMIDHGDRIFPY